jgi:hypothetical protein
LQLHEQVERLDERRQLDDGVGDKWFRGRSRTRRNGSVRCFGAGAS